MTDDDFIAELKKRIRDGWVITDRHEPALYLFVKLNDDSVRTVVVPVNKRL